MNGWQRLFTVLAVLVLVPTIAIVVNARPTETKEFWAGECPEHLYSQSEAQELISRSEAKAASGPWAKYAGPRFSGTPVKDLSGYSDEQLEEFAQAGRAIGECVTQLEPIASGKALSDAQTRWLEDAKSAAIAYVIAFLSIYVLGWGVGWVWRGFFPKRQGA